MGGGVYLYKVLVYYYYTATIISGAEKPQPYSE